MDESSSFRSYRLTTVNWDEHCVEGRVSYSRGEPSVPSEVAEPYCRWLIRAVGAELMTRALEAEGVRYLTEDEAVEFVRNNYTRDEVFPYVP